jgi:hypothetical protein
MKRTIGLLAAVMMCGCGVEAADLISVQSATMRYYSTDSAGLEIHKVTAKLSPGADERTACIAIRCTSDAEFGEAVCVDASQARNVTVGMLSKERCAVAEGMLTHESGEREPFAISTDEECSLRRGCRLITR